MRLIFLKLDKGVVWQHKWAWERRHEPLEEFSFLFNRPMALKWDYPEIGRYVWKSTSLSEVSGALVTVLENPGEIVSYQVVPITASGLQG
jgi:hypothetical protein